MRIFIEPVSKLRANVLFRISKTRIHHDKRNSKTDIHVQIHCSLLSVYNVYKNVT